MRVRNLLNAAIILAVGAVSGCGDSELVSVCEDGLLKRLAAPSAYHRIAVEESTQESTFGAYMAWDDPSWPDDMSPELKEQKKSRDTRLAALASEGKKPTRQVAYITYDAPNAYGTPIRGTSRCEFFALDGGQPANYNVRIDGQTSIEWLHARVRALQ